MVRQCAGPEVRFNKGFNKLPSRTKLQTACEQGSLWLIECSLKKKKKKKKKIHIQLL